MAGAEKTLATRKATLGINRVSTPRQKARLVFTLAATVGFLSLTSNAFAKQSTQPIDRDNISIYAGGLRVSDGYSDRLYTGAFVNAYQDDVGFHGDFVLVDREETAAYGAVGVSWRLSEELRPKIMIGTSSDNDNILPDISVAASVQIRPQNWSGWVVTPTLSYRSYRNSVEETRSSIEVAKYFSIPSDNEGYYVAQGRVGASFVGNGSAKYSFSGGLQSVRKNGFTYGLSVESGWIDYDALFAADTGQYFSVRPIISYRFAPAREIFLRGEYSETDSYDAVGASTGIKFEF